MNFWRPEGTPESMGGWKPGEHRIYLKMEIGAIEPRPRPYLRKRCLMTLDIRTASMRGDTRRGDPTGTPFSYRPPGGKNWEGKPEKQEGT